MTVRRTWLLLLAVAACGPVAAVEDAATGLGEQGFATLADGVAGRIDGTVGATGQALLGDDAVARRWARIDPDEPGRGRGAYLIEDDARAWLVTYATDGRTEAWQGDGFARAIEHEQPRRHGRETIVFAIRAGEPVVLVYESIDEDAPEDNVVRRCKQRCPSLRGFDTEDARLTVSGPGATVEELTTPRR